MKLSGSIAAFSHSSLPEAVKRLDMLGVDYIHVDCKDDPRVFRDVDTIRANTRRPIDLHIVSPNPEIFLPLISRFNIEQVSFQYEAAGRVPVVDQRVGARLGLALTLATELDVFEQVADRFQFLMLMATTPGESGGTFGDQAYERIRMARERFPGKSLHIDGGVTSEISDRLRESGVDCVVSGSFLSKAASLSHAILAIKNGAQANYRVRDFMLARNALPIVRVEELTLKAVLGAIGRHQMGLVLVVDRDDVLLGMITDGDVRRGILNSGTELSLPEPCTILNRTPLTLSPQATLLEALQSIEGCQRAILFIPVVDGERRLIGGLGMRQLLEG